MCQLSALFAIIFFSSLALADSPIVLEQPQAVLKGHTRAIPWLGFSKTGAKLLSVAGTEIRVWDLTLPRAPLESRIESSIRQIYAAAISPDGATLATTGQWSKQDPPVTLWDWKTQQVLGNVDPAAFPKISGAIYSVEFSPDGSRIVLGTGFENPGKARNGRAIVLDAKTGKLISVLREKEVVPDAEFSPDGKFLALSGGDSPVVEIVAAETSQTIAKLSGHNFYSSRIEFYPDWSALVTSGGDVYARIWELPDFSSRVARRHSDSGMSLRAKFRISRRVNRTHIPVICVSPNSQFLATACEKEGVKLWDAETAASLCSIIWPPQNASSMTAMSLAFTPDGKTLAVGGKDGIIRIYALPGDQLQNGRK